MTFLQPYLLWSLPLILLPVLIHLLNRMRHRPQPWAAMQFLVAATRSSVNNARLRQWLILLFRVLAVLTLILFLSRPLAGGWLGWALSPAPETILIVLDRSASMEAQGAGGPSSKREQAIRSLAQAAKEYEESSHLVLIESALRTPQEIARASSLMSSSLTTGTDTAADIPGLLSIAASWLVENRAGAAELWIASDLQRTNWQPDDPRWKSLITQFGALAQRVRIRLLALDQGTDLNRTVSIKELLRRARGELADLHFVVDIQSSTEKSGPVPLALKMDGTRSEFEMNVEGQSLRWRHKVGLGNKLGGGWGSFELPADGNRRDNNAYFAFGGETALRATIVGTDSPSARLVRLALEAGGKGSTAAANLVSPLALDRAVWEDSTLLVWLEGLPEGAAAQRVRAFVEQGGTVLFLPPGPGGAPRFEGLGWAEVQSAENDRSYRVLRWEEEEGPLAKSDEGISLPLAQTQFIRRQSLVGAKNVLAAFEDGVPLLARQTLGRGEIFFFGSLPDRAWSSLGEGVVLVPMVQRLLQSGSRRLQQATTMTCGSLSAVDQGRRWESLDSPAPKEIRTQAGVYRAGERVVAVNRPSTEDDPEVVDASEIKRLFGSLSFQLLQDRRGSRENLQGEIWRMFLVGMLLLLVAEAVLVLPPRPSPAPSHPAGGGKSMRESAMEAVS